jgi:hypothetical protein
MSTSLSTCLKQRLSNRLVENVVLEPGVVAHAYSSSYLIKRLRSEELRFKVNLGKSYRDQ